METRIRKGKKRRSMKGDVSRGMRGDVRRRIRVTSFTTNLLSRNALATCSKAARANLTTGRSSKASVSN